MAIVNLQSIRGKIRRLTGSIDTLQLPDQADSTDPLSVGIDDYINSFYLYDLPAQFRSLKLKDTYTFDTQIGVNVYPFNSEKYTTIEAPCFCAKREIILFQNPWSFYGVNYNWQYVENFTYGSGSAGPYSGQTTASPIIRSVNNNPATTPTPSVPGVSQGDAGYPAERVQNILITVNLANNTTLNVTDDGQGNLIGDCMPGGTIVYQTGVISALTFTSTIASGTPINIQYNPVKQSIPLSILFYQNQFTLLPCPDKGYTVEITAYRQPTQALMYDLVTGTGTPELSEWWELIAYGASKKIYEDRLDSDGIALMDKGLQEQYQKAYTRTYAQMGKQRINTIFAEQNTANMGSGNGFGFGGGTGF